MIESVAATRIGPEHAVNEDSYVLADDVEAHIVADGMGGQNAGEVASGLTVELVSNFVRQSEDMDEMTWPFGVDSNLSLNGNRLRTAVKLANRKVWKQADDQEKYLGMGSTIVAAIFDGDRVTVCSAGDSRAYRIRGGEIEQLTEDDSWVQVALSQGLTTAEQARNHPMRNLITKAIGAEESIHPQLLEETVEEGDLYLICSDGLNKALDDATLLHSVDESAGLQQAADHLVETAGSNGADDDVTVLLIRPGAS
jgi:protein phosphatase